MKEGPAAEKTNARLWLTGHYCYIYAAKLNVLRMMIKSQIFGKDKDETTINTGDIIIKGGGH